MKTVTIQTPDLEGKLISFQNAHNLGEHICAMKDTVDYFIREVPCTKEQKELLEITLNLTIKTINIVRDTEQIKITFK